MAQTLSIPKELDNIFAEVKSLYEMRDIFIKLPFGYKKALKCAKEAEIKRRSFWQEIYELYPEVREGVYEYNSNSMTLHRKEAE